MWKKRRVIIYKNCKPLAVGVRRFQFAADTKISSNHQRSELHLWQVLIY